jgi:thiosulfate/3-mercaptopyruvate sulfurtransferase
MFPLIIQAADLQSLLRSGADCLVFDCSFDLAKPQAGEQAFGQEHITGALYAHLDRDLSAKGDVPAVNKGRHPLPRPDVFAAWLTRMGVTSATQVVTYDRSGGMFCGRLWWMLKWLGHDAVAVLDGGLNAWKAAGGALASGAALEPTPSCQAYPVGAPLSALKHTREVADALHGATQTVLDARASPRFKGEVEPLDPVAGHIPGALNRPFASNFDESGRFKSATQLKTEFQTLLAGRDPESVVHHCGSGVSAVPNIIAMELAGLGRQALYAGSWSEWCNTPGLPCEKG